MARQASFRVAAVADLFRQLRMVSVAIRSKAMNAAEQLITDIEPQRNYPLDYVIYRITGYRSESEAGSTVLVGKALLSDLVTFVQRISDSIELAPDYDGRVALTLGDVARRLNVSRKTIQRYRRLGLVCHTVHTPVGRRIVCFEDALQRFIESERAPVRKASSFTRISPAVEQQMIDEARRLRDSQRVSLNEAAARIAQMHSRAHETIRGVLRRHDRASPNPIFTERGPLTDREHAVIFRAYVRGVPASDLAERFGRSRKAIHRVVQQMRTERLSSLSLQYITLTTFTLDDAPQVLLSPTIVRSRLNEPQIPRDAVELTERSRDWFKLPEVDEHALLGAYNFLKRRAAQSIESLPAIAPAAQLDEIEADLRWAALLKRRLVAHGLPVAIGRIEQFLHRPLAAEPRESIVTMIQLAVEVVSRAIDIVNPQRDQRVARLCSHAMDRALAVRPQRPAESRAAARHEPGSVRIDDPLRELCPWQRWLDPPRRWIVHVDALDDDDSAILSTHLGLAGSQPMTPAAIAAQRETTVGVVSRRIHRSLAMLRQQSIRAAVEQ